MNLWCLSIEVLIRCVKWCKVIQCVLLCLQDYIQRLMAEKADIDKRFHGMKDELITRLQNACAQRDEARAQVCLICKASGNSNVNLLNFYLRSCCSTHCQASGSSEVTFLNICFQAALRCSHV